MKDPEVSVITASLNAAATLEACLDSVSSQKGVKVEHIVVDGGSEDGTLELLASRESPGLVWKSEADDGIADAMNKGVALARGRWLLFLQADDHLTGPDILMKCFQQADTESVLISGHIRLRHADGSSHVFPSRGWIFKTIFKTTIPHQGALIRRDLFDQTGPYDRGLKIAMDYDWFLRAYWMKVPLCRVDEVVAEMGDSGISSSSEKRILFNRFQEERKIHFKRAPGGFWRMLYGLYWMLYFPYRKIKYLLINR